MNNQNTGLVSVIIPAFNSGLLIGRTIQSVLEQSYTHWEAIVIDDCSTDHTKNVVKSYTEQDSRIKLLSLDKNNGAPAAPRNTGIQAASGEWVAFLDADDVWHPRKLELQLKHMKQAGVEFSCTQMKDFYDDASLFFSSPENFICERVSFYKQQLKGRIPTSSVVVRRDVMLRFPFNEDFRYKAVEDYHCWLRIHQALGDSIKLKYPLLHYRRVQGQLSASKKYMLERIYMVHKEYPGTSNIAAFMFTVGHALGGFYYRVLKKGL
ncbi:MAG: glycosyltransferase family 2 protein [Pontibacterium sp.]